MKKKTGKRTAPATKKKTAKKTSNKTVKKSSRKPAKKNSKATSQKPAKKTAKKPAKKTTKNATSRRPRPISQLTSDGWTLRLYIAGDTPKSIAAQENLKRLCDKHLPKRCKIEVIDLVEHPELARADQILAIPTLVRKIPVPIKRIIGDLSNEERAMLALDVRPEWSP